MTAINRIVILFLIIDPDHCSVIKLTDVSRLSSVGVYRTVEPFSQS